VDVKTAETGELWDQSLRLTEITRKLKSEAGNATHFVVFDACRNTLRLTRPGSKAVVQSKGFLPITQESGMLIAYATAEGELASDVGAGAGPYAKVLAEEIVKPGVEAVYMFRRVQVRVRSAIGQEPWLGFSALGEVYLAGTETASAKPPSQPIVPPRPETGSLGQSLACVNAKFEDDCARAGCTWFLRSCMTRANAITAKLAIEKTPSAATTCDGVEIAVGQNERRCFKPGAGKTEHFKDCLCDSRGCDYTILVGILDHPSRGQLQRQCRAVQRRWVQRAISQPDSGRREPSAEPVGALQRPWQCLGLD